MTHATIQNITSCIICSTDVQPILDLGQQPLANSLIESAEHPFHTYPLGLSVCPTCAHGQLTHFVDPKEIFVDYLYASGTSRTLKDFFSWFADKIVASLGPNIEVLELATLRIKMYDGSVAANRRWIPF